MVIATCTTDVLYANGCSFTAGSELEQELRIATPSPSEVRRHCQAGAWPAHLGALVGSAIVVNEARGGGSNARAIRMTLEFVSSYIAAGRDPKRLLVALGITDLVRHEVYVGTDDEDVPLHDHWVLLKPNLATRRRGVSPRDRKLNRAYYGSFFSFQQAIASHVHQILGLQSFLAQHAIRYHLHEAMPNNAAFLKRHGQLPAAAGHLDARRYLGLAHGAAGPTLDPGDSFEQWCQNRIHSLGTGGHPLSEGHRGWAEILYRHITSFPERD
jgi:Family of unknown function (DUF6071)